MSNDTQRSIPMTHFLMSGLPIEPTVCRLCASRMKDRADRGIHTRNQWWSDQNNNPYTRLLSSYQRKDLLPNIPEIIYDQETLDLIVKWYFVMSETENSIVVYDTRVYNDLLSGNKIDTIACRIMFNDELQGIRPVVTEDDNHYVNEVRSQQVLFNKRVFEPFDGEKPGIAINALKKIHIRELIDGIVEELEESDKTVRVKAEKPLVISDATFGEIIKLDQRRYNGMGAVLNAYETDKSLLGYSPVSNCGQDIRRITPMADRGVKEFPYHGRTYINQTHRRMYVKHINGLIEILPPFNTGPSGPGLIIIDNYFRSNFNGSKNKELLRELDSDFIHEGELIDPDRLKIQDDNYISIYNHMQMARSHSNVEGQVYQYSKHIPESLFKTGCQYLHDEDVLVSHSKKLIAATPHPRSRPALLQNTMSEMDQCISNAAKIIIFMNDTDNTTADRYSSFGELTFTVPRYVLDKLPDGIYATALSGFNDSAERELSTEIYELKYYTVAEADNVGVTRKYKEANQDYLEAKLTEAKISNLEADKMVKIHGISHKDRVTDHEIRKDIANITNEIYSEAKQQRIDLLKYMISRGDKKASEILDRELDERKLQIAIQNQDRDIARKDREYITDALKSIVKVVI